MSIVLPNDSRERQQRRKIIRILKRPGRRQQRVSRGIREGHPDLDTAYLLSQRFVMLLASRRDQDLDIWLYQAEQSTIPEFQKVANGIRRDYAAVKAAFSSEISNGQVEGRVQRGSRCRNGKSTAE